MRWIDNSRAHQEGGVVRRCRKPNSEIAITVLRMPRPHGKAAIRRFLGAITYLSKFCSRLREVVRPLRDLTHLNQEFLWADQHTEASRPRKELVSQAPCLRYFNVNAPVVLKVDASEYDLSVALLQPATHSANSLWQPVPCNSSSLSPTEQRYAQIGKANVAIVHAFHMFVQLLFGKADVVVHSDHKPCTPPLPSPHTMEIGRASCRERV